jgi:hypothetical protein
MAPMMLGGETGAMTKSHRRMSTIDRTKHDEDIAERMIGGARMDRLSHPKQRVSEHTADDRPKTERRSHERRERR